MFASVDEPLAAELDRRLVGGCTLGQRNDERRHRSGGNVGRLTRGDSDSRRAELLAIYLDQAAVFIDERRRRNTATRRIVALRLELDAEIVAGGRGRIEDGVYLRR